MPVSMKSMKHHIFTFKAAFLSYASGKIYFGSNPYLKYSWSPLQQCRNVIHLNDLCVMPAIIKIGRTQEESVGQICWTVGQNQLDSWVFHMCLSEYMVGSVKSYKARSRRTADI